MFLNDEGTTSTEGQGLIGTNSARAPYAKQIIPYLLAKDVAVNFNTTDKQTLFTAPATISHAIITRVITKESSGNLTTAVFGFGWDSSAADVVTAATHTELTGATLYSEDAAKVGSALGAASGVFGIKCSTAQGAAMTGKVDVFGYLID